MGDLDPVPWETREAALGPPAAEIVDHVERFRDVVNDEEPYEAVKTVHDAVDDAERERTVPSAGEPFVTAYLLEKDGVIGHETSDTGSEYRSLVERRPDRERLRELFWERERTLWWIGLLVGVHPSLVTYWCYEYDIPLMERNYTAESMARIRAFREETGE